MSLLSMLMSLWIAPWMRQDALFVDTFELLCRVEVVE